tara:strand:- start:75 stop:752 length:678 start_codon:yes stop_codon:yes gene_type:complete
MAVISLWQVFDDYNELYNPESNSLVKLEPGDSITFELESSILISALRVAEGGTPDANLKLTDGQGNEVAGRGARALEFDRYDERNGTSFSIVRVFENIDGGEYTLDNLGTTTLWLVDDEDSANKLSGIVWTYLFYIGCCLGSPIGLVGLVLAIMVWTDKRKMPDQFVLIEDGRVIIGNSQSDLEGDREPSEAPNPFSDTNRQPPSITTDPPDEEDRGSWKSWDEG